MASEKDVAWAAGLFEGEGCIYIHHTGRISLSLQMTDRDVVKRFQGVVGVGKVNAQKPGRPSYKGTWRWAISGAGAESTLLLLRSEFGVRRGARADEALRARARRMAWTVRPRICLFCNLLFVPAPTMSQGKKVYCSTKCIQHADNAKRPDRRRSRA